MNYRPITPYQMLKLLKDPPTEFIGLFVKEYKRRTGIDDCSVSYMPWWGFDVPCPWMFTVGSSTTAYRTLQGMRRGMNRYARRREILGRRY